MLAVENFGRLLLKSTGGLADLHCRIKIFRGQNIGCEPLNLPKFSTAKILCYTVLQGYIMEPLCTLGVTNI